MRNRTNEEFITAQRLWRAARFGNKQEFVALTRATLCDHAASCPRRTFAVMELSVELPSAECPACRLARLDRQRGRAKAVLALENHQ